MDNNKKDDKIAAARQSMNPKTNEERGNIMPDEEKMEETFNLTASHNIDDPRDKRFKDKDGKDSKGKPGDDTLDDEEAAEGNG